ncbi:MAG: hypothetical protein H6707_03520 [Deltaproteobacteria bacterium]|nr:hypothetical protein [Deltaproteobacteria bacterium]
MRAYLLLGLVVLSACEDQNETLCRRAVREVIQGKTNQRLAIKALADFGVYALVDIEQELQVAPASGRLRLLEAIERIGDPRALPLLQHIAQYDSAKLVRERAQRLAIALAATGKPAS